jgi:hypothetical protein
MHGRKYMKGLIVLNVLFVSGSAFAAGPIESSNDGFEIGAAGEAINYSETSGGNTLDSESGVLAGVSAAYRRQGPVYLALSGDYFAGNQSYGGYNLCTGAALSLNHQTQMFDGSAELGVPIALAEHFQMTPVILGGYHQWNRQVDDETYDHVNAGGGLLFQWAAGQRNVLSVEPTASRTIAPQMKSGAPSIICGINYGNTSTFNLGPEVEYGVEAKWDIALTPHNHLFASVGWTHFSYRQSRLQDLCNDQYGVCEALYEPDSTTDLGKFVFGYAVRW